MSPHAIAAPLALSGRYGEQGRQAAAAIRAWASERGTHVEIVDDESDAGRAADIALDLAGRHAAILGPYGSGPARAVASALSGHPTVVFNHGGAATSGERGRWIDVLAPAERYWDGLADVLSAIGVDSARVAVLAGPTGFGRAVAAGAERSLERAGLEVCLRRDFDEESARSAGRDALAAGASLVVAGGRIEEEIALGRALSSHDVPAALVVCGIARAAEELGDAVEGWLGPVQWFPAGDAPPVDIGPRPEYPAAQALAACLLLERARERARRPDDPHLLWAAARDLRTTTFFGRFAVDRDGRQVAHAPTIVRWVRGNGGLRLEPVFASGARPGLPD